MNILFSGNIKIVTPSFCNRLIQENHLIIDGSVLPSIADLENVRIFSHAGTSTDISLEELFETYSLDCVIFFSGSLTNDTDLALENLKLYKILNYCKKYAVTSAIYLTLDCQHQKESMTEYEPILEADIERLCKFFQYSLKVTILKIPFLYDQDEPVYPLKQMIQQLKQKHSLLLAAAASDEQRMISTDDLADLIIRVMDVSEGGVYNVAPARQVTTLEICNDLKKQMRGLSVCYSAEKPDVILPPMSESEGSETRNDFGWIAKTDVLDSLHTMFNKTRQEKSEHDSRLSLIWKKVKASAHNTFVRILAVIVLWLIAEALTRLIGGAAEYRFADIRLIYVVIAASFYGFTPGMIAAILSCCGLFYSKIIMSGSWRVLFYNMENWLPFVLYLLVGSLVGYTHDKNMSDIKTVRDENNVLREKYIFLRSIYDDISSAKTELKQQVLGSHESFGRIFDITRKLEHDVPQEVLPEALTAMEDTLDNHSIAIYSVSKGVPYGRLLICSQEIKNSLNKSIKLDDYKQIMDDLKEDFVWRNTQTLENYPDFCTGIYYDHNLTYLIFIYTARFDQKSMYYINQINVLCGLTKSSLQRILTYNQAIETQRFYPDTQLLKPEYFRAIYAADRSMKDQHLADFVLCQVERGNKTFPEISNQISQSIRANDVSGIDENENVYILFEQADSTSLNIVMKRFADKGLLLKQVEGLSS